MGYRGVGLHFRTLRNMGGFKREREPCPYHNLAPNKFQHRPSGASRMEVCENRFFVPIPSHFNDFIPIPFPFLSET